MQRTERTIEIDAPVERVFDLLSDFESFPRWMQNIREVRHTGRRITRWVADAPRGVSVEWEAETTVFEPDHHIAWRSIRGDVATDGEFIIQETRGGTTLLRVVLGYDAPAGRLGALASRIFDESPEQRLDEDLARFAELAEGRSDARRARTVADNRRVSSRDARERIEMRPRRERARYETEFPRIETRRDYREQGMRHPSRTNESVQQSRRDYRALDERDVRGARGNTPPVSRDEFEAQRRFDEALRDARRSQLEGQRRYNEDRERDERQRYRDPRVDEDQRTSRRASGNLRPRRDQADNRYQDDSRYEAERRRETEGRPASPPSRHALTPRERELDRAERRRLEPGAAREKAFRRGIDRLVDDGPSSRWRRSE
jgi:uncharacterized protein YndB with AHSA1/START domain